MSINKYRFEEIKEQFKELLEEAIDLVPHHARARAESYWYAHISTSLDNDHDYMGGSMCSMQDTLEQFYEEEDNSSYPQFNCQQDWDDYVASNPLPRDDVKEDEEEDQAY
jgi:hypothetical protein